MNYQVVGRPTGRKDGLVKVTGEAEYTLDVSLPGMLQAKTVRSPHAHARIVRIDASAALALPGVRAVITGMDVHGHRYGQTVADVPLLAEDLVRFVGEKVAVVAADTEEIAERGRDLVEVEYEVLQPQLDPVQAMQPDAPLIHPEMTGYMGWVRPPTTASNVFYHDGYGRGDVERGFAEADLVFEDTYSTGRIHQAFIEPRVCVVDADRDGRIQVWSSHKAPVGLKGSFARAIGVEKDRVVVNPTYIGGDFGAKAPPWDEPLCYFLSLKTGRPVRMVMDYAEEFLAGNPRHDSVIRVKTGVTHDGRITAHLQEHLFNSGAYAGLMPRGFLVALDRIAANFNIPNARFELTHVYTNNVPAGYMRGPGEMQGTFAIECHIDEVARRLEMDPVDFRRKNIIRDGDPTPMDEYYAGIRAEETLDAAVERSNFYAPKPPNVGRGIAMSGRTANAGQTTVEVALQSDGRILVRTPIFEQGSGTHTTLAQIVAEEFAIDVDLVQVEPWNTDAVEVDSGVAGSWTTRMVVPGAHDAAQEAKRELLDVAAELEGWPVEALVCEGGFVKRTDSGESTPWPELLRRVPDRTISGWAVSKQEGRPEFTSFLAQVAEVAVDPETGQVTVLNFVTAHDVGTVLNPIGHQGQINGAVVMGLGGALMEELQFENGRSVNLSFVDNKIPVAADIPPLTTVLVESGEGTSTYNVKAIGETPLLAVAPAIANAIRDAVGVRMHSLPLTAEKVREALRRQ